MKATLVLADPDERVEVDVDGRDHRATELQANRVLKLGLPAGVSIQELHQRAPLTVLAWQAWHASRRDGHDWTWADLEPRIVDVQVEPVEAVEDADPLGRPTGRAASAD